jgi:hypothetical protein
MALTDHSDLYTAVTETGLHLIAGHIMRQRQSLFNYASSFIVQDSSLACEPVRTSVDLRTRHNPLFTMQNPLPLLGVDALLVALSDCAQLIESQVDFLPGKFITLHAELNPPLSAQHFSMTARISAGWIAPGKNPLRSSRGRLAGC